MGLRAGIVGANFAVMLCLAAWLGLETFGPLAALWGAALVAGTVVSLGGPVILLRMLTDGTGLRGFDICNMVLIVPGVLALTAYLICMTFWPAWPWAAIIGAGYCANILGCLASVMRSLESVQVSMVLRDAGPQLALGLSGLVAYSTDPGAILALSAIMMAAIAVAGALWISADNAFKAITCHVYRPFLSLSQWASSVLGMVVSQIDLIVGGALISAEQLGVYAVLRRVANLVALPVSVATWVSAPAISAAYGKGSFSALCKASREASRIAVVPGVGLFVLGIILVPLLPVVFPEVAGINPSLIFFVLLLGALGQVFWAASFTVATLCGAAHQAMTSRAIMIVCYLLWFAMSEPEGLALGNAVGYVGALTIGGFILWGMIKRGIGVDTSAAACITRKGGLWRTS